MGRGKYIGLTVDWDYKKGEVHISMSGYVEKALKQFQHKPPRRKQDSPYTKNNGIGNVGDRIGIMLTNIHGLPKNIEWDAIKKSVNLSPNNNSWMPRGTQVVKNSHLLPFVVA